MSLQELIDKASPGDTVRVPPGEYQVDTSEHGALRLKSDITLDLTDVVLRSIPTESKNPWIIQIWGASNVTIVNGTLVGERNNHIGPTDPAAGGGGGGIDIRGSHFPGEDPSKPARNVRIKGTKISDCFCDGIYVWDAYATEIDHVTCDHNRRQGMSVVHADGVYVHDSQFSNSGGTPPGCGIDLENDLDSERIINVQVGNSVFYGNQGACIAAGSPGAYHNIRILANNSFDMKTQPIWAAGGAAPLGTPWWAFLLNRSMGYLPSYRWWGYPTSWYHA